MEDGRIARKDEADEAACVQSARGNGVVAGILARCALRAQSRSGTGLVPELHMKA